MKKAGKDTGLLRIELEGEFCGGAALALGDQLSVSDLASAERVVLSLSRVHRIDQAGLAMLVRLYSHVGTQGGRLELVDVPTVIRQVLDRVGFSRLVSYVDGSRDRLQEYNLPIDGAHLDS